MRACPTCGQNTDGSEGWSSGQCDDCYLADHEPPCGPEFGCTEAHHFLPCPSGQ